MNRLTTSIAQIRALGPCATGYRLALTGLPKEGEITAAEARAAGVSLEDMSWYLSIQAHREPEIRRRLQLWKADCADRVLRVFEEVYFEDDRPAAAISAARSNANRRASDDHLSRTIAAALVAENQAWADGNVRAAQAAAAARTAGEKRAAWPCVHSAVESVRERREAELEFQYTRLVEWFTGDGPGALEITT